MLEIYKCNGYYVAGNIATNYKLLCKDKEYYLYFLTEYEERDPSPPIYKIGKYKLSLR